LLGAASADATAVNTASRATSSIFSVLHMIRRSSVPGTILQQDGSAMAFFPDSVAAVRDAIYAAVVEHGIAPSPRDAALTTGLAVSEVERAYRELADAHVIVLEPGAASVVWAPPFSVVPTAFRARCDGASWFAPCAWDAFGIAAALGKDVSIDAGCAWSGAALACGVADGHAYGDALIHLLVPAAHFWDDIFFT
jgi:hypothetical protein